MILEWRHADFPPEQKLIGVVYDAGAILRRDVQFLLGWTDRRLRWAVEKLHAHPEPLLRAFRDREKRYGYLLTAAGVKFAHQILGIEGKAVTMDAQWTHALGLNAILIRYLQTHGFDGVRWFQTREATDELWMLRKLSGATENELRATAIRPDAALRTPAGFWWIEYDNATEGSRQIWRKYQMYLTHLGALDPSFRCVVWVTKHETRRRFLETLWHQAAEPEITMNFYVEGEERFIQVGR